jgi:nicotinamidase-related amidase
MKALLVIDMLNEFIYDKRDPAVTEKQAKVIIPNIRKSIDYAHKRNIPVIYVNCSHKKSDPCIRMIGSHAFRGTKGAKVIEELKPVNGDYIVNKISYDGFYKTTLEKLLKKLKVSEIYLTGVQTDCCVRETAVSGAFIGFKVFLLEDCCDSCRRNGHDAAVRFMRTCVGKITNSNKLW